MADEALIRLKQLQWRDETAGALQTLVRPYAFELEVFNYPDPYPINQALAGITEIKGRILLLGYDDFIELGKKKFFLGQLIEIQATVIEEDGTSKLITVNNAQIAKASLIAGNMAKIKELGEINKGIVEYKYEVILSFPTSDDVSDYVTIA